MTTLYIGPYENEFMPEAKYEVNHPEYGTLSTHATAREAIAAAKLIIAEGEADTYVVDAE